MTITERLLAELTHDEGPPFWETENLTGATVFVPIRGQSQRDDLRAHRDALRLHRAGSKGSYRGRIDAQNAT